MGIDAAADKTRSSLNAPRSFQSSGRLIILDFYRFVAAICVFLYHFQQLSPGSLFFIGSYGLFVDMFFLLSGFVLAVTYGSWRWHPKAFLRFIVRRLNRIYPLYLAMLLLILALLPWSAGLARFSHTPLDFVESLALVQAWGISGHLSFNYAAWSISAEMFCYLAFPALLLCCCRFSLVWTGIFLLAGIVLLTHGHLPIWANQRSQLYAANHDFGCIRALPSFCTGILLCRIYLTYRLTSRLWLPLGAATMLVALVLLKVAAKPDLIMCLFALGILATAAGERNLNGGVRGAGAMERLGDSSYGIYMLHSTLIAVVLAPLWSSVRRMHISFGLFTVFAILLVIMLADLVFRYFEDPARRYLNRTFSPGQVNQPSEKTATSHS